MPSKLKKREGAALPVTVNGQPLLAGPVEFSSGSVGYFATGKVADPETGKSYQVTANIVEIGSNPNKGNGSKIPAA